MKWRIDKDTYWTIQRCHLSCNQCLAQISSSYIAPAPFSHLYMYVSSLYKKYKYESIYHSEPKAPQICCKLSILPACCNLSIWSSSNKSVKIRLVATCHLQTCYNLLKQLSASLWVTSFQNELAIISLLTTCNGLVVYKLSQAMRTHPEVDLL